MITAKEAKQISTPNEIVLENKLDSAIRLAITSGYRSTRIEVDFSEIGLAASILFNNGYTFSRGNGSNIFLVKW